MPSSDLLVSHSYGKSGIRIARIDRHDDRDEFHELSVDVSLEGDFEEAYLAGDNANVLPTDTMKNTVYALAHDHPVDPIEPFALHLALHFISEIEPVAGVVIDIQTVSWGRAQVGGAAHRHTFLHGGGEAQVCTVDVVDGEPIVVRSGITGLSILKTTDSAFEGFLRDEFTTLKDEADRILGTTISATWTYDSDVMPDFNACRETIRTSLIETFATHDSRSVQETLYAMACAALAACEEISDISLSLPNRHYIPADLAPLGKENDKTIFVPIDVPHGMIEASVHRDAEDDDEEDDEDWDMVFEFEDEDEDDDDAEYEDEDEDEDEDDGTG